MPKRKCTLKKDCVQTVLTDFTGFRLSLRTSTPDALKAQLKNTTLPNGNERSLTSLISAFFEHHYGDIVAAGIRKPLSPVYVADETPEYQLPCSRAPLDDLVHALRDIPLDGIAQSIRNSSISSKARIVAAASTLTGTATMSTNTAGGSATNNAALMTQRVLDLPDPYGRYAGLARSNPEVAGARVANPDVRDRQGVLITPGEYDSKIQDGDYVEVEVILKLWEIPAHNRNNNSNGSRIYQLVLRSLKLLPFHTYSQANLLHAPDGPDDTPDVPGVSAAIQADKRQDDEEQPAGQSPTKKSMVLVEDEDDWVMTETAGN
ncbi:hypothetical protein JVT61DRAFT_8663 [Boletus reticuloceps]|uniref:Uncharacterized protein n=1 Tax=Boletus reticuloceps TaxID=495285 RepID=A0A8I2YYX2_9AGAM|nr:hypothetical protein JVT61DRAFT_8663 [Boletus reticuloceps]